MFDFVLSVNPTGSGLDFTVDRTTRQCAPDTVRCEVDLSNVIFDTPAPGVSDLIDPRYRRLDIRWNFGDSGNWTAPTKLLSGHEAKTIAYGAFATHVYTAAGTYDITLEVREWSTGYYATKTKSVTVVSADSVYPTTQTICVNNVGDSDFTGAPTGAKQINVNSLSTADSEWTDEYGSSAKRFLFKGGSSFTLDLLINSDSAPPNLFFGSYGTGKATIVPTTGPILSADGIAFSVWGGYRASTLQDLRFSNLTVAGTFDPSTTAIGDTTGSPWTNGFLSMLTPADLIIHGCDISGMRETAVNLQYRANSGSSLNGHWVFADSTITACGQQYWFFVRSNELEGASGAFIGSAIYPQSDQIDGAGLRVCAMRENGHRRFHCRSTEFATMDSGLSNARFLDTPTAEGDHIYTVHSNRFEGALTNVNIQGNWTQGMARTIAANFLYKANVHVADYSTQRNFLSNATGLAMSDNLFLLPGPTNLRDESAENAFSHSYIARNFSDHVQFFKQGTVPDATDAIKCEVYNNTLTAARTASENDSVGSTIYGIDVGNWTGFTVQNNIIDGALLTDANSLGPLTTTTIAAPHSLGFVGALSKTLDTSYAPAPADVVDSQPDTGSGALATATGLISYRDIAGTIRPEGSEDQGCWQVSGV